MWVGVLMQARRRKVGAEMTVKKLNHCRALLTTVLVVKIIGTEEMNSVYFVVIMFSAKTRNL